MNKTQFYLSQCAEAASKSPMCFTLGAVMVKGGKVLSSGHNHHRPHYDGAEIGRHGHRKPVSMHAEMHAIFSVTGMSPSFKTQVQGNEWRVPRRRERAARVSPSAREGSDAALSSSAGAAAGDWAGVSGAQGGAGEALVGRERGGRERERVPPIFKGSAASQECCYF